MIEHQTDVPFDHRVVESLEPSSANPADQRRQRERHQKQQEVMNHVLANSVVSQLMRAGCDTGQVIDFATEILTNVTQNGFDAAHGDDPLTEEAIEIQWRLEETGDEDSTPVIHGPRVTLCPLTRGDLPLLDRWRNEPRIQRTCSRERLTEVIDRFDDNTRNHVGLLVHDEHGEPIGLVSLFNICRHSGQAELAKLLGNPNALGAGYAREASSLLIAYGFEKLGLERIYIRTNGVNMNNIHLNEKLGFRFEGILRSSYRLNGELVDVVLMSMLAGEYLRKYGTRELKSIAR